MLVRIDSDDAGLPAYVVDMYAGGSSGDGFADGDVGGTLVSSPATRAECQLLVARANSSNK